MTVISLNTRQPIETKPQPKQPTDPVKDVIRDEIIDYQQPYYGACIQHPLLNPTDRFITSVPLKPHNVFLESVNGYYLLGQNNESGSIADPFAWLDTKYQSTKDVIKNHSDQPIKVYTRSDLVAHDDYLDVLPSGSIVHFYIDTDNPRLHRLFSPGCPSVKRLKDAAIKLRDAGYKVIFIHTRITGLPIKYNRVNELSFKAEGFTVRTVRFSIDQKQLNRLLKVIGE